MVAVPFAWQLSLDASESASGFLQPQRGRRGLSLAQNRSPAASTDIACQVSTARAPSLKKKKPSRGAEGLGARRVLVRAHARRVNHRTRRIFPQLFSEAQM